MSKSIGLAHCRECEGHVSTTAAACPHCGATAPVPPGTEPKATRWWVVPLMIAWLLAIIVAGNIEYSPEARETLCQFWPWC